ncbi:hypothetical protein HaLaN_27524 [Haematococcus lacustris]|uniref:Uncharacterized protein n=1 Tax=Haematococcus lacustris TaxID=44745 RepID=A0A6A0A8R1_HAELA|nr:hypothetical protein HaLaN_27524 [Haematococcus lacustris]
MAPLRWLLATLVTAGLMLNGAGAHGQPGPRRALLQASAQATAVAQAIARKPRDREPPPRRPKP